MEVRAGHVAVVTGAASGIGRSLAAAFAARGASVVLADVEQEPLDLAVDELCRTGAKAIGVRTDVRDAAEVEALAEATIAAFGGVNIICNNAGVETGAAFDAIALRAWEWVMDVNFWGVLHGCRTFLPLLREAGEGHIVNTGSVASVATGIPTMTPYAVSKFAVLGLSECLEIELRTAGEQVGVSIILPGPVRTRMIEAERNRPSDVPPTEGDPARGEVLERLRAASAAVGIEPEEVAALTIGAIEADRFFVLPHPEPALAAMRARLRWMESDERPPVRAPTGYRPTAEGDTT